MQESDDMVFADDDLLFAEEDKQEDSRKNAFWKVMIVDDETEVHNVTRLALDGFVYEGKGVQFVSAHSGAEARDLIREHHDTNVVLLDVVMEDDDAGLQVVRYIREELGNMLTRIVLRTGQPGQAPEKKVIIDYDINDYKTKTELTSQKLFTTMVAALRSYRDLKIIDNNRKGLEKIIGATSSIFELKSLEEFISGVLIQLSSILTTGESSVYLKSLAADVKDGELYIIAGTGDYAECSKKRVRDVVPVDLFDCFEKAHRAEATLFFDRGCIIYFKTKNGTHNMIFLEGVRELTSWDRNLLEIFCRNIAIALDNIYLVGEVVQKELAIEKHRIEEEKVKDALSRYVSPQVAGEILAKEVALDGRRTRATILFFDIRDFTAKSENIPAEEVVGFLNRIFTLIVDIIFEHGGTLDKFMGDGLMAIFGVPLNTGKDEFNAICAAMKIRETIRTINEETKGTLFFPLKFGIGIHTGDVVAGNVGSSKRLDYTVIGRAVNQAARIEGLCKPCDRDILISEETFRNVVETLEVETLPPQTVRGIQAPISIYHPITLQSS